MKHLPFLLLLLAMGLQSSFAQAPASPQEPAQTQPSATRGEDSVSINFPKTSVIDILPMYEALTGKKLIRDSNLAGPELSIMVSKQVPREEAIRLIESSLLLNGYTIVPVDKDTIKILGPSNSPRKEGVPLYTEASQLFTIGDQVISFFAPLSFIAPQEAATVVLGVVQPNAYGSIVPAPTANALIITDKTPVIQKALAVLQLIDREPAKVVTRFIPLQRASAETVVETLNEMFGTEEPAAAGAATAPAQQQPPPGNPEGIPVAAAAAVGAQYEDRLLQGKSRFIADKRTNRVLVVTRTENYRYVSEVIAQLDAAGSFEQPLVKVLNYLSVNDAFPVLTNMLEGKEETSTINNGNQPNQNQNQNNQNSPFQGNQGGNSGGSSSGGSGGLSRPDRLSDEDLQSPPLSASLGNIQIIGDTSANSIIVYGPPDGKERARQILELLDKRPRQVYLAAVIGQLRVGDSLDYGVSYLVKYQNFTPIRNLLGDSNSSGAAGSVISPNLLPDALPDPSSLVSPDTFAQLSGLTIYGSIAESVDVFARFLETTNRFQTLARPVVYTTNNKKATILSGQRVPVPTSTLTSTTPGLGDNNSITSNIQYQDVVLKLEVIPLINSDNEVNLVIAQTNDNIVGSENISGNEVPVISTQEITTSVRVRSGSTIVLGGLINDDSERNTDGIPYVNRIPILGPLLGGGASNRKTKSELIVMIQPIVVDSDEQITSASMREGMRTTLGADGQRLAAQPAEFFNAAPPTPTPVPKKKSWLPWSKPKPQQN